MLKRDLETHGISELACLLACHQAAGVVNQRVIRTACSGEGALFAAQQQHTLIQFRGVLLMLSHCGLIASLF